MEKLPIRWNELESQDNLLKFNISFSEAKEVVLNMSSLKIRNIGKDYSFIGPVNDLSKIVRVTCIQDGGVRLIVNARKASPSEESAYFNNLAMGGLR